MLERPVFYIIGYRNSVRVNKLASSILNIIDNPILYVVDNCKSYPLTDIEHTDSVMMLKGPDGGFTPGFNFALRHFKSVHRGHSEEYPVILNDDLEIEEGFVEAINTVWKEHPDAGIVAPMQVASQNPALVICGGFGAAYPSGQHATGMRMDPVFQTRSFKWITFCAVALKPSMIDAVGELDNDFKMYFSDSDYCIRARSAGYTLWLTPHAIVRHENHASTAEYWKQVASERQFILDQWWFEMKWSPFVLQDLSHS